jgi:hypothetical protein
MITMARIRLALGAFCALLAATLSYECFYPIPDLETPSIRLAASSAEPAAVHPAFQLPPESSFAAIDARPIFDPSRRPVAGPPEQSSADGSAAGTLPPMTLIGIIIDRQTRLALIKLAQAPQALSYAVGSSLAGWQIVAIEADKVVLRAHGAADQIVRMTGKSQKPAPQPGNGL